jgi:ketosteroid isomerase-like protein
MKKLVGFLMLLMIGAGLTFASGDQEATERQTEADQAAIAELWKEYGNARIDGDAARRLAIHDPNALKMPQDRPMFKMADVAGAVQSSWDKQDANSTTEMYVEPQETFVMGNYAYSMGTYRKTVTPKGGGEPVLFVGKFLTILRKNADGNWLIYRDSYSSSTPPPPPKLAQFSFGTPTNLGPLINSEASEGSPRISADGLELYFNSSRPGGSGGADIWVASRPSVDAEWGAAVNLGPSVNSDANEIAPAISADGLELYFSDYRANRPGGRGKSDIWVVKWCMKNSPWGEPMNLGAVVNSPYEEITPEISANGLELYFETDRPGGLGSDDIWVSRRASRTGEWGAPVWLGPEINGKGMDHCPNITSDGLLLFYDANLPNEPQGDLIVTYRPTLQSEWGQPVNLGRALSGHWASSISFDGTTLYFASNFPGGVGGNDIWQVSIRLGDKPVSK